MIKHLLLAFILLSSLVSATTKTVNLREEESFLIKDKNITILDTNNDDKVKICINNLKTIASNDQMLFNGIYMDIKSVKNNITRISLERNCKDKNCSCDKNCDNNLCFDKEKGTFDKGFDNEGNNIKDETAISKEDSNANNSEISNDIMNYFGIFLLLIVFIFILLRFNK